jgi:AraC-like DNA-binding protein
MTLLPNTTSTFSEARRTGPGVALQVEHSHAHLEFNLVVSGRGTYFLADGQHDLMPGTLVWLLPGQSHRLMRSPTLDMWVVTLTPDYLDAELLSDIASQPCRLLSSEDAIALDRLLAHISQDTDEPMLYRAGLKYAFRSAWHASMTSAGPATRAMHPAVLQALSVLRLSSDTPTASALARKCGVTQDYLGQLLVEHTGRGFVEWRNRTRLERFHTLYPESGDLLTAALDAGFGSYTQFHRVFSDMIGTTPGEWAKSGAQEKAMALPSASVPSGSKGIKGGSGGSNRMVWYTLSELTLPGVARWFAPAFGTHLLKETAGVGPAAVASHITSYADLERFKPAILDQVRDAAPQHAERFVRAITRNELFEAYRGTMPFYQIDLGDLADILGLYVSLAWIGANRMPTMGKDKFDAVAARVRHALAASGAFDQATREECQGVAAMVIVKTMFLRNALVASRAGGNEMTGTRVSDAANATALATIGVELRANRLFS